MIRSKLNTAMGTKALTLPTSRACARATSRTPLSCTSWVFWPPVRDPFRLFPYFLPHSDFENSELRASGLDGDIMTVGIAKLSAPILVPINREDNWTLIVVDGRGEQLYYCHGPRPSSHHDHRESVSQWLGTSNMWPMTRAPAVPRGQADASALLICY